MVGVVRRMGLKWVSIEDYDSNYMSGYSAWSPPNPMVENKCSIYSIK